MGGRENILGLHGKWTHLLSVTMYHQSHHHNSPFASTSSGWIQHPVHLLVSHHVPPIHQHSASTGLNDAASNWTSRVTGTRTSSAHHAATASSRLAPAPWHSLRPPNPQGRPRRRRPATPAESFGICTPTTTDLPAGAHQIRTRKRTSRVRPVRPCSVTSVPRRLAMMSVSKQAAAEWMLVSTQP
jgi:hypothetical protein